jgi:hypothetical protein
VFHEVTERLTLKHESAFVPGRTPVGAELGSGALRCGEGRDEDEGVLTEKDAR